MAEIQQPVPVEATLGPNGVPVPGVTDVNGDEVPAVAPAPAAKALEEEATETLYIQNLNERIKIPGLYSISTSVFYIYARD
jgi:hypothetical protein